MPIFCAAVIRYNSSSPLRLSIQPPYLKSLPALIDLRINMLNIWASLCKRHSTSCVLKIPLGSSVLQIFSVAKVKQEPITWSQKRKGTAWGRPFVFYLAIELSDELLGPCTEPSLQSLSLFALWRSPLDFLRPKRWSTLDPHGPPRSLSVLSRLP